MTDTYIRALAVSSANLFAGTYDGGVRRRPTAEMTSVEMVSTDLPTHFSLEQNFSNSFNPETMFEFGIFHFEFLRLSVFDFLGREVAVLVNEQKPAGTYQATWDAARYPSGVYFCRLRAGEYTQTRKMILTK